MKRYPVLGIILISCFLTNTVFANEVASIAVMNLSSEPLSLMCEVFAETSFYHSSEKIRLFKFTPLGSKELMDESIDIENLYGKTLKMHCYQENFLANNFDYRVISDDESASVQGRFQYESSYPGAFTFK